MRGDHSRGGTRRPAERRSPATGRSASRGRRQHAPRAPDPSAARLRHRRASPWSSGCRAEGVRRMLRRRRSTSWRTRASRRPTVCIRSGWRGPAARRLRRAELRRALPPAAADGPPDRRATRTRCWSRSRGRDELYSDEEMKVASARGRVADDREDAADRRTPTAKTSASRSSAPPGAALLVEEMDRAGRRRRACATGCPRAFGAFCRRRPLHAVDHARVSLDRNRFSRGLLARVHATSLPAIGADDASTGGERRGAARESRCHHV